MFAFNQAGMLSLLSQAFRAVAMRGDRGGHGVRGGGAWCRGGGGEIYTFFKLLTRKTLSAWKKQNSMNIINTELLKTGSKYMSIFHFLHFPPTRGYLMRPPGTTNPGLNFP
jgi:hypothetical protein